MRLELVILLITGFLIINVYHDGKYLKIIKNWKKYYQMAFYGFLGLSLFIFIKKYPGHSQSLFSHANSFIKFMPIDKDSSNLLSPLFNYSSKYQNYSTNDTPQYRRMINSGSNSAIPNLGIGKNGALKNSTKRCVSETKKKFVASNQNWKCASCSIQLPAWFEVDHKVRLDRGGDNHINNLEALCRNCHGKKTAMESML
jgi:5-methylcytosine-specific restriction endonuclease McrA